MDNKPKPDPRYAQRDDHDNCRFCGEVTSERGPFGEALHASCWEEEDELIDSMST